MNLDKVDFETRAIHAGRRVDPTTGSIIPPLYQTATYVLEEVGRDKGFDYSRSSNPTRQCLEENLAAIEGGEYAVCFASGMSAVDSVVRLLSSGDHVVSIDDVYGGTSRVFDNIATRGGLSFTYVDTADPQTIADAILPNTKVIWIETPTNPLLKITDLIAVKKIAEENNLLVVVDSTFSTPYLLKPLEFGADIIIHSTTKYLSGHNQIIGGACITNDKKLFEDLKYIQKSVGAVPGPFDCWLTLLGIKTLALRMERHCANGEAVAEYLDKHPKIERVIYPGLPSHPQHEIAKTQFNGFGGMISFELKGGFDAGVTLMNSLKLASLAESLGAVETMVTHPASMTHAEVPVEARRARGLTDGLVRLSAGIESAADIIADLEQALEKIEEPASQAIKEGNSCHVSA